MRPVSDEFPVTQEFGEGATQGVAPDPDPNSGVGYLVYLYKNYQPFGHAGGDIGCPVGTPVRAARSGTVVWCDWDVNLPGGPNGYSQRWDFYQSFGGRIILVQYGPSDFDAYAHLSEFRVRKGQFVNEGDLIALSGDSSGGQDGVLGPHLHTERIVDLSYSTGNGLIYGRTDPTTVWGGTITTASAIINKLQEAGVALEKQDLEAIQSIVQTERATVVAEVRAHSAYVLGELSKKIADSEYQIKVFAQASDNFTGDRVINDNRAVDGAK